MKKITSFHYLAEIELNDAALYYNKQKAGLGLLFISEVERVVKFIGRNPESASKILKNVRSKIMGKFPYSIMYSVGENYIRVLAISSQKRRPFYWRGRK
jgi:hypothetical protein